MRDGNANNANELKKNFRIRRTILTALWWMCLLFSWIIGLGTMARFVFVFLPRGDWAGDFSVLYTSADLLNAGCCESSFEMSPMRSLINKEGLGGLAKLSALYDLDVRNRHADQLQEHWGDKVWIHSQYTLPPGFAALLRPMALPGWPTSRVVWLALLVGSWGLCFGIVVRQGIPWWAAVSVFLFVPVLYGMIVGNVNVLLLAFVLTSWNLLWPRSGKPSSELMGGVLLGLAAITKLFLGIMLFEVILARRWKVLAGAALAGLIILLIGIIAGGGLNAIFAYHGMLADYKMAYDAPHSQSIIGFWTRFFQGAKFILESDSFGMRVVSLPAVINAPGLVWPMSLASIMILLMPTLYWLRGLPRLAGLSLVGTLAFPVAWYHAHCLMLFPWLLITRRAKLFSCSSWLIAGGLLLYQFGRFYPYFGKHVLLLNFPIYGALLIWAALALTFGVTKQK